jgi:hypothetical protein
MSKAFTATAFGLIMDDFANGRNVTPLPGDLQELTWTTKIADLLPGDWKLMDPWASEAVGVRDALSHVSGLPRSVCMYHGNCMLRILSRHDLSYARGESAIDLIHRMQYLRPAFELREKWHYTNIVSHITFVIQACLTRGTSNIWSFNTWLRGSQRRISKHLSQRGSLDHST